MTMAETTYEHVVLSDTGVPMIEGTTTKVIELVAERTAYGWSPEEMYFQHPYLTLGQIYSAMAYYWDHEDELNQDIKRRNEEVARIRQTIGPSPLVAKLKARGLL